MVKRLVWAPTAWPHNVRACAALCIDVAPARAPASLCVACRTALGGPHFGAEGLDPVSRFTTFLLLESVADHSAAGLDADCAVGVGARALDADAGVHNLLQDTPLDNAAVVETHQLRVGDRVVLVRLEQEQVSVLRRA